MGKSLKLSRIIAALAVAIGTMSAMPASAQNSLTLQRSSIQLYNACIDVGGAEATSAACACVAGYFGGAMSDREYDIIARLGRIGAMIEAGASDSEVQAEILAFFSAGYTQADADAANARTAELTARGDVICAPYANSSTS